MAEAANARPRPAEPARERPHAHRARPSTRAALGEEIEALSVEVEGARGIVARGMGAFAAVAQGSEQEPALITLRYEGRTGATGADARRSSARR